MKAVLNDIFIAAFTPPLMAEIFKKQKLLSMFAMRQMFEKLAHSSIMKLNEQSMSKALLLIDLLHSNHCHLALRSHGYGDEVSVRFMQYTDRFDSDHSQPFGFHVSDDTTVGDCEAD